MAHWVEPDQALRVSTPVLVLVITEQADGGVTIRAEAADSRTITEPIIFLEPGGCVIDIAAMREPAEART